MASASCAYLADTEDSIAEHKRNFRSQYDLGEVLGEGTFGKVVKVRCRQSGEERAMKLMKYCDAHGEEGVPSTTIREIAILKELEHEHIVRLHDVFCQPGEFVLVFELADSDLAKYMDSLQGKLSPSKIRDLSYQLLLGLEFCHSNRVIHRDLKPQNLLLNRDQKLKIADFGLSRAFSVPLPQYTPGRNVITLWYRPPELLLGLKIYGISVDMWSVGAIFAEMATGAPLFRGESEIETLFKIFQKLGTPTKAVWPEVCELPSFNPDFPKWPHKGWPNIRNTFAQVGPLGIELLDRLLRYETRTRISARAALLHAYFLGSI